MLIRFIGRSEIDDAQKVLNHPSIIAHLGGFTQRQVVKDKAMGKRPSFWVADPGEGRRLMHFVGAFMLAGRPQLHMVKYGEIGVVESYRRQRIASALYLAGTMQGILEGRRLFEDTIVGDNRIQFKLLPTLGLRQAGELRHRTGSAKSICLFQLSLLDDDAFETIMGRVPADFRFELAVNDYTRDVWLKNVELWRRHSPQLISKMIDWRYQIASDPRITVIGDEGVEVTL